MRVDPLPYRKIVFVCVNKREDGRECCAARGSEEFAERLKAAVKARGWAGKVRVSRSGCQDRCAQGPSVMLFPDNLWFHDVGPADLDAVLEAVGRGLEEATGDARRATGK